MKRRPFPAAKFRSLPRLHSGLGQPAVLRVDDLVDWADRRVSADLAHLGCWNAARFPGNLSRRNLQSLQCVLPVGPANRKSYATGSHPYSGPVWVSVPARELTLGWAAPRALVEAATREHVAGQPHGHVAANLPAHASGDAPDDPRFPRVAATAADAGAAPRYACWLLRAAALIRAAAAIHAAVVIRPEHATELAEPAVGLAAVAARRDRNPPPSCPSSWGSPSAGAAAPPPCGAVLLAQLQ